MKVFKFGGTSAGSAQRLTNIYKIIRDQGTCMVILSAMSGSTNTLLEISRLTGEGEREEARKESLKLKKHYEDTASQLFEDTLASKQYIDQIFDGIESHIADYQGKLSENTIVATGERISTFLFHQLLLSHGISSALLDATTLIHLNGDNEPDVEDIRQRLHSALIKIPEVQVYISQGFICSNNKGEISNLGRGGSDYSASLFGAAVGSEEIQIWTDIDGVQNNDPRYVEGTHPIRKLLFDEAAELAYFGAKILHPSCVLPAQKANIPVLLKNTLHPDDPGTMISKERNGSGFKAVAARDNITAIKIKSSRMLLAYGFLRKIFEVFESYKTSIDMITTSEVAVSITIDDTSHLQEILEALESLGTVTVENNKTIVGIVGTIVADETGYAHALFTALKDIPIRMISYGASPHNISILINSEDKLRTLQALNSNLFQS
ncbi:MAG: aspartate kinase [Bacteroidales bacterium]|nr:aspartate kinase [Bacteroidales bacterium]